MSGSGHFVLLAQDAASGVQVPEAGAELFQRRHHPVRRGALLRAQRRRGGRGRSEHVQRPTKHPRQAQDWQSWTAGQICCFVLFCFVLLGFVKVEKMKCEK